MRLCADSGFSRAAAARGGMRKRIPSLTSRRRVGRTERWVTLNRGSVNRPRRTLADLASITSSTLGKSARPTLPRISPVASMNNRPPASANSGAPDDRSGTGAPSSSAADEDSSRKADMPIGVIGA